MGKKKYLESRRGLLRSLTVSKAAKKEAKTDKGGDNVLGLNDSGLRERERSDPPEATMALR